MDSVKCWGDNSNGQLGTGTAGPPIGLPVATTGLSNVQDLGMGSGHTCAVLLDNTVRCWGFNGSGQLGIDSIDLSATPIAVPNITDAISIDAGTQHTCIVRADETVACWGDNENGELGQFPWSATPAIVDGL